MDLHNRSIVLALVFSAAIASSVHGQETREAEWTAQQQQKAANAKPYEPSTAERWLIAGRREFIEQPAGFYPYFASVYSGGGFTLGAGYRTYLNDRTHFDVKGLYSIKSYKFLELSMDSWDHADGRVDLHARTGWRDATQVSYYGLGIDSSDFRTNFRLKQWYAGAEAEARPVWPLVFGAAITYEDYAMSEGKGSAPSIEEIFTPATAPGLGESPNYLHGSASAAIDWRKPSAGYARSGGLYQITYHSYNDQDEGDFTFSRLDGEIVQHFPILRENWVISLHGLTQSTLSDDDQVPYFLLPSLGSGSTLRGYPSWRFRDRHSLLLSGEFRWIPNRMFMDMAIFYDTGKVVPRWNDLDLSDLKSDVGVGVRFHGPLATPLRVELAKGSEGMRLVFAGSAAF